MKIINATVAEITEQDIMKKIEKCGRVCYKSEEQITDGSALHFVRMLTNRKHWAMLEHAPLVLMVTERMAKAILRGGHGTYLQVSCNKRQNRFIISGSVRAWLTIFTDEHWLQIFHEDIISTLEYRLQSSLGKEKYAIMWPHLHVTPKKEKFLLTQDEVLSLEDLTPDEARKHLYLTAHFTCDRGVSHELVRHRPASFAQESTRYCNYAKEKFGQEITVIDPHFQDEERLDWIFAMEQAEETYFKLLKRGLAPQMARTVLPNSLKTEILVSCNLAEWQHIINLRYHGTTGAPHPQMKEVMNIWYELVMNKEGYKKWLK